jgi:hypothetical protein
MTLVLGIMLGPCCLFTVANVWIREHRCDYCGQIVGHEPSCPWSIVG